MTVKKSHADLTKSVLCIQKQRINKTADELQQDYQLSKRLDY